MSTDANARAALRAMLADASDDSETPTGDLVRRLARVMTDDTPATEIRVLPDYPGGSLSAVWHEDGDVELIRCWPNGIADSEEGCSIWLSAREAEWLRKNLPATRDEGQA